MTLGQAPPTSLSTWTSWSAQALLLPYLEQTPLYNAANFNWCIYIGQAGLTNSTVYNTRIAAFLCPSDALAGQQNINSYDGCIGTSTIQYPTGGTTNGVYQVYIRTRILSFRQSGLHHRRNIEHDRLRRGTGRRLQQK